MTRKRPFITSWQLEELTPGLPFVIERIETFDADKYTGAVAHRHSYYALCICVEGESCHMLDFEKVVLRARDIIMIVPGQIHHPQGLPIGSGWLIAFNTDFLTGHAVNLPLAAPEKVTLSGSDFAQVLSITQQLEKESREQATHYAAMLRHYLSAIITLLQRNTVMSGPQSTPTLLFRFRELLATHFLEWTKPGQYASALCISADHLNEVVKQHTGQTASAMITERRILEAKRLLLHATESIKEIAWHLQFNEVSYFNKFFKQHTGYTPASFRESLREKYLLIPE